MDGRPFRQIGFFAIEEEEEEDGDGEREGKLALSAVRT